MDGPRAPLTDSPRHISQQNTDLSSSSSSIEGKKSPRSPAGVSPRAKTIVAGREWDLIPPGSSKQEIARIRGIVEIPLKSYGAELDKLNKQKTKLLNQRSLESLKNPNTDKNLAELKQLEEPITFAENVVARASKFMATSKDQWNKAMSSGDTHDTNLDILPHVAAPARNPANQSMESDSSPVEKKEKNRLPVEGQKAEGSSNESINEAEVPKDEKQEALKKAVSATIKGIAKGNEEIFASKQAPPRLASEVFTNKHSNGPGIVQLFETISKDFSSMSVGEKNNVMKFTENFLHNEISVSPNIQSKLKEAITTLLGKAMQTEGGDAQIADTSAEIRRGMDKAFPPSISSAKLISLGNEVLNSLKVMTPPDKNLKDTKSKNKTPLSTTPKPTQNLNISPLNATGGLEKTNLNRTSERFKSPVDKAIELHQQIESKLQAPLSNAEKKDLQEIADSLKNTLIDLSKNYKLSDPKLTPEQLVNDITNFFDHEYVNMKPTEFNNTAWQTPTKLESAPHITRSFTGANEIGRMLVYELLTTPNPDERNKLISKLKVARGIAAQQGKMETWSALSSVLDNSSIARLKDSELLKEGDKFSVEFLKKEYQAGGGQFIDIISKGMERKGIDVHPSLSAELGIFTLSQENIAADKLDIQGQKKAVISKTQERIKKQLDNNKGANSLLRAKLALTSPVKDTTSDTRIHDEVQYQMSRKLKDPSYEIPTNFDSLIGEEEEKAVLALLAKLGSK